MSWSTSRGERARDTRICAPLGEVQELVAEQIDLQALVTAGPQLVDLGLLAGGRVQPGGVGARLPSECARSPRGSTPIGQQLDHAGPVGPPVNPVATTGRPRRLIARATLTPLPPGIVSLGDATVPAAEPEVRDLQGLVDRGVE